MKNEEDYILEFKDRDSYLYVYLAGKDSFSASLSYWNEIADQVRKGGYKKLLVHENLVGEVTAGEVFDLIGDLEKSGLVGIQIAFFDENPADGDVNHFGQLVAGNRGGTIQIFQSLEAAEKWICSED